MSKQVFDEDRLITVAIHSYSRAMQLKELLEKNGITAVIQNVNLGEPSVSSGVRVRIHERRLPLALKIIEQSTVITEPLAMSNSIILVPVDFTLYSEQVIPLAFDFANQLNLAVVLLHCVQETDMPPGYITFNKDHHIEIAGTRAKDIAQLERQKAKLNLLVAHIAEDIAEGRLPKVNFSSDIVCGVPEDAIEEYSKIHNVVLSVMGSRDIETKKADLIGSVTAEVVDSGQFPVLSIPEGYKVMPLNAVKKVMFITNLCQDDLLSFDSFINLMASMRLEIAIVPAYKELSDSEKSQLLEYCRRTYKHHSYELVTFPISHGYHRLLNEYVTEHRIEMIIIPNKKRNIFSRLLSPSIASKLLYNSRVPMFIVPCR